MRSDSFDVDLTMNPEIAVRYAKVVERWQNEYPRQEPPLEFSVPEDYDSNLQACVIWGNATVDSKFFYCDANYGRRYLKGFFWAAPALIALLFLFYLVFMGIDTIGGVPVWMIVLSLSLFSLLAYRWWSRIPRWENHVFSREDGKLYSYAGKDAKGNEYPHRVKEFYDQHFTIYVSQVKYQTFYSLLLMVHDEQSGLNYPITLLRSDNRDDVLNGWYFLVRFMDKDWPFNEKDYKDLQEIYDYHIKELGWKFGGILREDGSRVKPN